MKTKYAIFFSKEADIHMREFYFLTVADFQECIDFTDKVGNIVFYVAEAIDNDGNTPHEKLKWNIVGFDDMKLTHVQNILYSLMDQ